MGHPAPQPPGVEHPPSGVLLVAGRSAAAHPLDRPGGARRRALPLVALGVAARPRRRALRASRRRPPSRSPTRRACRADLVAEDLRRAFRRPRRAVLRPRAVEAPVERAVADRRKPRRSANSRQRKHVTRHIRDPESCSSCRSRPRHRRDLHARARADAAAAGDDGGLGRRAADAADPGRQRLGRRRRAVVRDTSPKRRCCTTPAACPTPPT